MLDPADFDDLSLRDLAVKNRIRAEEWVPLDRWTLNQRMTELTEEVGEIAGKLKRISRMEEGVYHNKHVNRDDLLFAMGHEMADALISLDLLAQTAGIDLASVTRHKFDRTSEKHGLQTKLGRRNDA